MASLRCRTEGYVSRGWVGLPPDFHWAENSEKPQDSEFSQQRLRELLESSLRSPEDNLPEAPPIPGIRYVMDGSLDNDILEVIYLIILFLLKYIYQFAALLQNHILKIVV